MGCGSPAPARHDEGFDGTRLDGTHDPSEAPLDPVEQQFASAEGATPVSVPASLGAVTSLAAGLWHNCALDAGGEVHCWGYGSLGETRLPPGLGTAVQLGLGEARACAVNAEGGVRCSIWLNELEGLDLPPGGLRDGAEVVISGGPDYYPGGGQASPSFAFRATHTYTFWAEASPVSAMDSVSKTAMKR